VPHVVYIQHETRFCPKAKPPVIEIENFTFFWHLRG